MVEVEVVIQLMPHTIVIWMEDVVVVPAVQMQVHTLVLEVKEVMVEQVLEEQAVEVEAVWVVLVLLVFLDKVVPEDLVLRIQLVANLI